MSITENKLPLTSLDTIDSCNKTYGLETLHPLVSVVYVKNFKDTFKPHRLRYGIYALWLKHGTQCTLKYGRKNYDYQEGTIVSFAPGQVVEVETNGKETNDKTIGLLFHPDLVYGTELGKQLSSYHFFDYASTEALHLSQREQQLIIETLNSIALEVEMPIDTHSRTILVDRIKLVLDYCKRFYDRQFITRHKENSDVLMAFEESIKNYFTSGKAQQMGLPSIAYFAEKACLSTGYFSDLIRKETGLMAKQLIQNYILDMGKQLILEDTMSLNQISDKLGFQYPQHFTRFFKRHTGVSPSEYRLSS